MLCLLHAVQLRSRVRRNEFRLITEKGWDFIVPGWEGEMLNNEARAVE